MGSACSRLSFQSRSTGSYFATASSHKCFQSLRRRHWRTLFGSQYRYDNLRSLLEDTLRGPFCIVWEDRLLCPRRTYSEVRPLQGSATDLVDWWWTPWGIGVQCLVRAISRLSLNRKLSLSLSGTWALATSVYRDIGWLPLLGQDASDDKSGFIAFTAVKELELDVSNRAVR